VRPGLKVDDKSWIDVRVVVLRRRWNIGLIEMLPVGEIETL
jgi:hypothetical protein